MTRDPKQRLMTKPLRFAWPEGYRALVEQFEPYHIHPFDVQAGIVFEDDGLTIVLRYGEGLSQEKVFTMSKEHASPESAAMVAFFNEAAKACQQTIIADAFKMMKA